MRRVRRCRGVVHGLASFHSSGAYINQNALFARALPMRGEEIDFRQYESGPCFATGDEPLPTPHRPLATCADQGVIPIFAVRPPIPNQRTPSNNAALVGVNLIAPAVWTRVKTTPAMQPKSYPPRDVRQLAGRQGEWAPTWPACGSRQKSSNITDISPGAGWFDKRGRGRCHPPQECLCDRRRRAASVHQRRAQTLSPSWWLRRPRAA